MPRQRTQYRRRTYNFPDDFPERLKRFQEESGLSWSEIARRIGTYPHTVKRKGCSPISSIRWRCWAWPTTWGSAAYSPSRERRAGSPTD